MKKELAIEMTEVFSSQGIEAERMPLPGTARVWAVAINVVALKKEMLEQIIAKYSDLGIKVQYGPDGISNERAFIY